MNLPSIAEHPYDAQGEQEPEYPEDFLERGRVPALIQAVKILKEEIGDSVAIIGGIIGPFSISSELVGITECLKLVMRNPSRLQQFMKVATRSGIELAGALIEAGADVICVEDMMASVSMISPKSYKENVLCWETELISKIQVPTVLHICGKVDFIIQDMISTGATAISFEPKTDMEAARRAVAAAGRKIGLIGGVDTMDHLFYGNPAAVWEAALRGKEEGYSVIAPSCSIPPATTTENLKAMAEAIIQ
jgi:[methyl-Co(III) methanol-specific corrinoid protein]:coenzyme M methyltransferase